MVAWLSGQLKRIAHKWPSPQTRRNFNGTPLLSFLGTIVSDNEIDRISTNEMRKVDIGDNCR